MEDPIPVGRMGYIIKEQTYIVVCSLDDRQRIILGGDCYVQLRDKLPKYHCVPVVRHENPKSVSINGVRLNLSQEDVDTIYSHWYTWLYVV